MACRSEETGLAACMLPGVRSMRLLTLHTAPCMLRTCGAGRQPTSCAGPAMVWCLRLLNLAHSLVASLACPQD